MPSNKNEVKRVFWAGPFGWTGPKTFADMDETAKAVVREHVGFYQIYLDHFVHGPNTLVYVGVSGIGRWRDSVIGDRLAAHWRNWAHFESANNLRVHVGVVGSRRRTTFREAISDMHPPEDVLRKVEELEIWYHSPAYNHAAKIAPKVLSGPLLVVQNWGQRGKLSIECTSDWLIQPKRPEDNDSEE